MGKLSFVSKCFTPVVLLTVLVLSLFWQQDAFAQEVIRPFEIRYQTEQRGGVVYVSNNILSCNGCSAVNQAPPSGNSDNNDFTGKYIDIDGFPETFSSSSADLKLPNCSSISFAGLYWGGAAKSDNPRLNERNRVKFKGPGMTGYADLTADVDFGVFESRHYQYFKDVTTLVNDLQVENGTYTVGNVVADQGDRGADAGWTLVIVYRQDLMPVRNLTVFDGFVGIPTNAPDLNINLSGFLTPPNGPVSFELGFVAYEGDRGMADDYLLFNGQSISDAAHSRRNTFNSSITRNGNVVTTRNPAHNNTLGYDASIVSPDNAAFNYLPNGAQSATITVATDDDRYAIGVVSTAIDVYTPTFRFTHQFKNLTGSQELIYPSDEVLFEYEITNIGIDASTNTVFIDTVPPTFNFVPGSLEVQYGNGLWTSKTDMSADDEADFLPAGNKVTFRLGTGANSTAGGGVASNGSVRVRYKARLTDDCDLLRCSFGSISKFGRLNYSGNVNATSSWGVKSTPVAETDECSATGPLWIPIGIPPECNVNPADRTYVINCEADVSEFLLPKDYFLYAETDAGFSVPLKTVANPGKYIARRLLPSGCVAIFNVNIVLELPSIIRQPASAEICEGDKATFNIEASGRNLRFEWQRDSGNGIWEKVENAESTTLILGAVSSAEDGSRYRVRVTDSCGNTVVSSEAQISVRKKTSITRHPASLTVCEGETAEFAVVATGDGLLYQWEKDSGTAIWEKIESAYGATLSLTSVLSAEDGSRYRVRVTDSCGNTLASSEAQLSVRKKASITRQPASLIVCEGETAEFAVVATGDELLYQWEKDSGTGKWEKVESADGATLSLTSVSSAEDGSRYRVRVTDSCGNTVVSSEAHLSVRKKASITRHPASLTVCEGETAEFAVVASGDGVLYQWEKDSGTGIWEKIESADGATLSLTSVLSAEDGSRYRVRVTDSCGNTVVSSEAHLSVRKKASITRHPASLTVCEGENAEFAVVATGDELLYQWENDSGTGKWEKAESADGATLNLTSVLSAEDGSRYRVRVTDSCGNTVVSSEAQFSVRKRPLITGQPASVTVCEGENTEFSVDAIGDSLVYQWQKEAADGTWQDVQNATGRMLPFLSASPKWHGLTFRVVISSKCDTIVSNTAMLKVNRPPTAVRDSFEVKHGVPFIGSVASNDVEPDNDVTSFTLLSVPQHGILKLKDDGSFTFIPEPNWFGLTTATYAISDGNCRDEAVLTFKVLKRQYPPIAKNDQCSTTKNTLVTFSVTHNDTDADGSVDVASVKVLDFPAHGTLTIHDDGTVTYHPAVNFVGSDTFTYLVKDDENNWSEVASVTLVISDSKTPPVASDDEFEIEMDTKLSASAALNDANLAGARHNFREAASVKNGQLIFSSDGSFTYQPKKGFSGIDSFAYQVCNEYGLCDTATVKIRVTPFTVVNLTPALSTVTEGGKATVTATLIRPFEEDVVVTIVYSGTAIEGKDYRLADQFQMIRIPKGKIAGDEKITIYTSIDNMEEGEKEISMKIGSTSNTAVRIGSAAAIMIADAYPAVPNVSNPVDSPTPANSEIVPEPFVSPNGDTHNEFFLIRNIENYPDNEVVIFNRWGSEIFRARNYDNSGGNVFKGMSNRGLTVGENEQLTDGVYFYIINTRSIVDGQAVEKQNKGYLLLKRE